MTYKLSDDTKELIKKMNIRGLNIDQELDKIKEYIDILEKDKQSYIDDLRKLREEYDKDEEVKQLKEKVEFLESNSLYILSENQKKQIKEFSQKHYDKCHEIYEYITVMPTEIGIAIGIECSICGEKLNLTNYDEW